MDSTLSPSQYTGSVSTTVCVPVRVWWAMVAIWYMYSVAVFVTGSFGVQLAVHDRPLPVVAEQGEDGRGLLGGAAIDELALVVVAQSHVLGIAEALQGARSHPAPSGRRSRRHAQGHDPDDDEERLR